MQAINKIVTLPIPTSDRAHELLAAAMRPFGSLSHEDTIIPLAFEWLVDPDRHDIAGRLVAATAATDESSCSDVGFMFQPLAVRWVTPTSGTWITVMRVAGEWMVEVDFDEAGSTSRALEIMHSDPAAWAAFVGDTRIDATAWVAQSVIANRLHGIRAGAPRRSPTSGIGYVVTYDASLASGWIEWATGAVTHRCRFDLVDGVPFDAPEPFLLDEIREDLKVLTAERAA